MEPDREVLSVGERTDEQLPTKPRKPWIAVLLSVLASGLGHLYAGEPRRGLAVYVGGFIGAFGLYGIGVPKTFPGLLVFLLVVVSYFLWVLWDSARIARRNRDYVLKPFNRWYWYVAAFLVASFAVRLAGPRLFALSTVRSFKIPSGSMEPAIRIGDHLIADMTAYRSAKPSRGDLAIFISPEDPNVRLTKRVIGLPGERIEIRHKVVYVNGQRLEDPWGHYSQDQPAFGDPLSSALRNRDDLAPVPIPEKAVFLIGDDRDNSYDSRFYGPVDLSLLQGRPLYVYWSPDRSRIGMSLR